MTIYLAGAWLTTVLMFACWCDADSRAHMPQSGVISNLFVIAGVSAVWPLTYVVLIGMAIRSAVLRVRERAIVEGKKRFRM